MAFIALHELGHFYYRHHQHEGLASQEEESQADAFALSNMAKMHMVPEGLIFWFTLISTFDGNSEYDHTRTHPPTASRLAAISEYLNRNAKHFIAFDDASTMNEEVVRYVASQVARLGELIGQDNLRQFMRMRGQRGSVGLLKQACDPGRYQQAWMDVLSRQ